MDRNPNQNNSFDLSTLSIPLNNGERYPPIPLPYVPNRTPSVRTENEEGDSLPMLEAGQVIICNGSAYVVTSNEDENYNPISNDQARRKAIKQRVQCIIWILIIFAIIAILTCPPALRIFLLALRFAFKKSKGRY